MKQSEKLDIILNYLYDRKFDGHYYDVGEILSEYNISIGSTEAYSLGEKLGKDGLVNFEGTFDGALVEINAAGIGYVEDDSYSHQGQPIINQTINISGSTNTNIIQNSKGVNIKQSNNEVEKIIGEIKSILQDTIIELEKKNDIEEYLAEIQTSVENNVTPKSAYRGLLTMTSEISSVGSLIVSLGQLLGL